MSLFIITMNSRAGTMVTVGTDAACDFTPVSLQTAARNNDETRITNQVIYNSLNFTNSSAHIIGGFNNCTDAENNVLSDTKTTITGNNSSTTISIMTTAAGGNLPQTVILENLNIIDGATSMTLLGAGINVFGNESVQIIDSIIQDNNAPSFGGGIYIDGNDETPTHLTIQNSIIRNNTSDGSGGGVYISENSEVTIDSSLIELNEATNGAGIGLNNNSSELTINDSQITQNTASNLGGGINCLNENKITVNGNSTINANQASFGGGLAITGGCTAISFSGDTRPLNAIDYGIYNNTATTFGGGIFINNGGRVDLIGNANHYANLTGNEATLNNSKGGGIYLSGEGTYARFINARVSKNSAVRGAGISVNQSAKIQIRRSSGGCFGNQICSLISENSAFSAAAINLESCGSADIYQSQISNNQADSAIVLAVSGNFTDQCHTTLEGNLIFANSRLNNQPTSMISLSRKARLDFSFNTLTDNNASTIFSMVSSEPETQQELNINGSIIWNAPATPISPIGAHNYSGNCFNIHDDSNLPAGFGNILRTEDPVFSDPANKDYSTTLFSPYADYCDTTLYEPRFHDIIGTVRGHAFVPPVLGTYDMGAFEYDDVNINNVIFDDGFE